MLECVSGQLRQRDAGRGLQGRPGLAGRLGRAAAPAAAGWATHHQLRAKRKSFLTDMKSKMCLPSGY